MRETDRGFTRRRFLSLGAAMGAGAALVACGGSGSGDSAGDGGSSQSSSSSSSSSESSDNSETTGGETSGGTGGSEGGSIASTTDVPEGEATDFQDGGDPAVLVHLDGGDFVAYSAVCTHQGCTVAYKDDQLVCPCHGSVFDPSDGASVVAGPAPRPLPEIQVEVRGGEVFKA